MRTAAPLLLALLALLAACSGAGDATVDATAADASVDAGKDAMCASTFGDALTSAFGRVDGTVVAVIAPGTERCAMPNRDHVIVQVAFPGTARSCRTAPASPSPELCSGENASASRDDFGGEVYRMVVNVLSDGADRDIRVRAATAPLPAPAFAPGWHPGLSLDYPRDLSVHSGAGWEARSLDEATAWIAAPIEVGAPIAVYATSSGGSYAHSAHLVHRNGGDHDGAIVIDPTGAAPRWLLFSFADQTF